MANRTDSHAAPHELSKSMQRATYRKRRRCEIEKRGHPAGSSDDVRMAKAQYEKCTWLEDGLPIQQPAVTSPQVPRRAPSCDLKLQASASLSGSSSVLQL
ncbi:unnamed protein product [Symbiodinium sp. KB8]|nr:unnamed protein product [Symbiodinium sp. KB8]